MASVRAVKRTHGLHSQMFSLEARRALTTETRGQNQLGQFWRHNYGQDGTFLNIPPAERPYAPKKAALLPDEFVWRPSERHRPRRDTSLATSTHSLAAAISHLDSDQ